MSCPGRGFYLLFIGLAAIVLLIVLCRAGKCESLDLDMADINLSSLAVVKGQSGLNWVTRYANFAGPDIGGATGDNADNAVLPFGIHYPIDYLVKCAITSISDDKIVAIFSGPGCQVHRLPTILFQSYIGAPAGGR